MPRVSKSKAVTKAKRGEVINFSEDAYSNNFSSEDLSTPFLRILQSGSPECKKSSGKAVPGAEEGMIFNSITGELYDGDEGVLIIPCFYERRYSEYESGKKEGELGDFVASHPFNTPLRSTCEKDDRGRLITSEGNILRDTAQYACIQVDEEFVMMGPVMITFSSSGLSESRRWNTMMQGITGKENNNVFTMPMFSQIYRLTSQPRTRGEHSWCTGKITHVQQVADQNTYTAARNLNKSQTARQAA